MSVSPEMKKEETGEVSSRDRILDVAEISFARRGYAGVGMREVAEGVGLGKSSLFHHFRSKADLYSAVCVRILGTIEKQVSGVLQQDGRPAERFERGLSALIDVLAQHPTYARILLRSMFEDDDLPEQGSESDAIEEAIGRVTGPFGALLEAGMESNEFRPTSVSHVLLLLVGPIVFPFASGEFGESILSADVFDPAQVARLKKELLDLVRTGLLVPQNP